MRIKALLIIGGLIISPLCRTVFGADQLPDLETKVGLELGLEKRVKSILEEVTGTDKLSVSVIVHLYTEKERVTLERQKPGTKKSEGVVLPGVPLREKLGEEGEPILAPLTYEEHRTMIKRLTVNIFLDSSMTEEMVSMVERITKALLGIDPSRGDEIVIQRIPFGTWHVDIKAMLQPPDLYWVAFVALGILVFLFSMLFLFGPFRRFFVQLINTLDAIPDKIQGGASFSQGPASRQVDMLQQHVPVSKHEDQGKEKKPFYFISEADINNLIYLCQKEKPEGVAIVLSYINPHLAARVIASLDKEMRDKVTQELSQVKERPAELVQALEKKMKERIDYMVGGEDRLQQILNYSDISQQKDMLKSLQVSNPSFADRVKKLVFAFEDLVSLDPNTLQMLIRNINPAIFAQVLKSMPEEFKKKIFAVLPEGLTERLEEEITLGKSLTARRIEEEKRVIIQLVKNFEQQGLIDLGK